MTRRDLSRTAYARLTARERIVTELEAYKAGKTPDPRLLSTMPPEQRAEYARYTQRLEHLDSTGRAWVLVIDRAIGEPEALAGQITALKLVRLRLQLVQTYLWLAPGEPITEREYL